MPLYEYACECGYEFEEIVSVSNRDAVQCFCGATPRRLVNSGANLVGICWDKTFSIGGTGRTFHSNAELRAYQKENEGWETVSTKDRAWKDRLDIHRDKADKMFQKAGFKDKEHWSQISKREKAKGGDWVRGG